MRKPISALRKIRKQRGLSQIELGKLLNLNQSSISSIERKGIQQIKTAKRYAEVLQCDWRDLLSDAFGTGSVNGD